MKGIRFFVCYLSLTTVVAVGMNCEEARGHIDTVVQSLDPQMQESVSCTSEYNNQTEENFDRGIYVELAPPSQYAQYVFPDIHFSCKGCISNITFYTKEQMVPPIIFSILLWSPYRNSTDNSSVYVLRSNNNYSINVTETLISDKWAGSEGYRTPISLEEYSICFEQGNVFGISVLSRGTFTNSFIFKEKNRNVSSTIVYQRARPSCQSLRSIWYPETSQEIGNVLIAVGVRETVVSIVTTAVSIATTTATVFPTSSHFSIIPSFMRPSSVFTNTGTTPGDPVVSIFNPSSPTPSLTPSPSTTSSTSHPEMSMLAITAAGAAGGILGVTLIITLVVISVCVVQRQKRKYKPDVEPYAVGTSSSFQLINQVSSPTHHGYDVPSNFFADSADISDNDELTSAPNTTAFQPDHTALATITEEDTLIEGQYTDMSGHHMNGPLEVDQDSSPTQHGYDVPNNFEDPVNNYDEPRELDRAAFQHNQTALIPITEGATHSEDQYTDMSGHRISGSQQERRYQVPRSATHCDTPHRSEETISDYDNPTALDSHQDSRKEHKYHVLEQKNQEPVYFVLEPGPRVPTADERKQWATGSGGSQDSVHTSFHGTMLFENKKHYWEPADHLSGIYNQLAQNKCREIPQEELTFTEEIGSGEFGTVSRATWKMRKGGRMNVAVKQLKTDASEEDKTNFIKEGARMMQFFHINVVKLHGMVTVGPIAMLVVELMPNGDLKDYLKKLRNERNPPPPSQLLRFGKDIALGMRHLANKGFVHRDLAARNIFLNDGPICKIGDFGMTRAMSHTYKKNTVEQIPLRWTAPEAFSEWKYTEKSDVYSYGMVLFEIWSIGRKPLPQHDNNTLTQFIKQGGVQYPPPGCPRGIYELMIRCWNPEYRERQTFADICDYVNVPDDSLLHWSSQDKRISKKAMQLGADLGHGANLYPDLQHQYRKDDD